tara:strand:- start:60 stop:404 length:345 start_codon:yes stop_codon:yes gene_type:complete
MNLLDKLSYFLKIDISYLEVFIYLVSVIIIVISVVQSTITYFNDLIHNRNNIYVIKSNILENISLALSFILSIEILKIFYIKTYKQLILVGSLVFLKLVINYFINLEIIKKNES